MCNNNNLRNLKQLFGKKQEPRTTTTKSFCPLRVGMKTEMVEKSLNVFLLLHLNMKTKAVTGHKNEHELMEYREFRKRTNSSRIMSYTVSIQKINMQY